MKYTKYFHSMRSRPDRDEILIEWVERVVQQPERQQVQADKRIRKWARIEEAGGKYLRVIVLEDGETIHNAFFDRGYTP